MSTEVASTPAAVPDADRLPKLNVDDALAYAVDELGFSTFTHSTILRAMKAGDLHYKLVQGRRRTSKAALRAWLISGLE